MPQRAKTTAKKQSGGGWFWSEVPKEASVPKPTSTDEAGNQGFFDKLTGMFKSNNSVTPTNEATPVAAAPPATDDAKHGWFSGWFGSKKPDQAASHPPPAGTGSVGTPGATGAAGADGAQSGGKKKSKTQSKTHSKTQTKSKSKSKTETKKQKK